VTQVSDAPPRNYRMTRQLSPAEHAQLVELYGAGTSAYQLARGFNTDRHTVTRHLRHRGTTLRSRQKLTPELTEQTKQL
jgi:hypothetical protein